MGLPYTLQRLLRQTAVIESPVGETNELGARESISWAETATAKCCVWWWKGSESTGKTPAQQSALEERTIDDTGGTMIVPKDTVVTTADRVARILRPNAEVLHEGPFRIIAVQPYEDHLELSLEEP